MSSRRSHFSGLRALAFCATLREKEANMGAPQLCMS